MKRSVPFVLALALALGAAPAAASDGLDPARFAAVALRGDELVPSLDGTALLPPPFRFKRF